VNLLVINSGSPSIKFSLFAGDGKSPRSLYEGEALGIGSGHASFSFQPAGKKTPPSSIQANDSVEAIGKVVEAVTQSGIPSIHAVGYRVVHPGPKLNRHIRIDDSVLQDLDQAVLFAPLHDPSAIKIIRETMARFPDIPHFACFDTIFHQTMPEVATAYPIPSEYRNQGVKRYGAHGLSCESIIEQMRDSGTPIPHRMAIAHLGSGCSVTALLDGQSIDTTMGLTPTGGIVMGTRPGDLDPGLVLYLLRQMKGDRDQALSAVEQLLNHDSGIAALSGLPNDMRSTRKAAAEGNAQAKLAIAVFARSVRKAIGSFSWLLGGLDAIVFTGGIGEHDPQSRADILDGLSALGIHMDPALNNAEKKDAGSPVQKISASQSKTEVLLIPAKEDWMIAIHMQQMLGAQ
jgi:acetate kinase